MNYDNEREENVRMTRRRQQKQEARKRWMKIGAAAAVFLLAVGAIAGLYFHGKNTSSAKSAVTSETKTVKTKKTAETTSSETKQTESSDKKTEEKDLKTQLEAVVTDYSKQIEEKTPVLIEEYQAEIQNNTGGVAGLSAIANQKARELQAISDEGISKLRAAYQAADDKSGVDLATLINQLSANYTNQVAKISDIYLRTSAALQAEMSSSQSVSETTEPSETTETTGSTTASDTQTSSSQYGEYAGSASTNETTASSQSTQAASTVVLAGEGPNQIAQRTGVPVETILALNGMSMDDYFLTPGEVLKLN